MSQSVPTISFGELKVESRPLASGSFKSVYKAVWARDEQQVAVLVLRHGASAAGEVSAKAVSACTRCGSVLTPIASSSLSLSSASGAQ